MIQTINAGGIKAIVEARQELEVEVAKALRELFNDNFLNNIKDLVDKILEKILETDANRLNTLIGGSSGCQDLAFWNRLSCSKNHQGLTNLSNRKAEWDLETCSDIIRLFGEITEGLGRGKNASEQWSTMDKGKGKLRPGPTFDKYDAKTGWGHRHRAFVPEQERPKRRQAFSGYGFRDVGHLWRGVELFRLEDKSVIGAMDRTFAVKSLGGDVSGTTTDSMWALNWSKAKLAGIDENLLSALQLLPLVTMVGQGHHSIAECAYPLTRFEYLNYCIGYYGTLTPLNASETTKDLFSGVLQQFSQREKDLHCIVWQTQAAGQYIPGDFRGYLMTTDDEVNQFKKIAHIRSAYAVSAGKGLQSETEARNVLQSYCPGLRLPQ